MSERGSSQFQPQFQAVLALAAWNDSTGGRYAWFRSLPSGDSSSPGGYVTELVRLTAAQSLHDRNKTFSPSPSSSTEPDWMKAFSGEGLRLHFGHEKILADGSRTTYFNAVERHAWQRDAGDEWRLPSAALRPAQVGRACVRWCLLADTVDDLASVVGVYLDWMKPHKREQAPGDNDRMGRLALQRSLELTSRSKASYATAGPLIDQLARLSSGDNRNHRAMREVVELTLRECVLGVQPARGSTNRTTDIIPRSLSLEAVTVLDARGILTPRWWLGTCISGGGAITAPDLLPVVYEKLAGDNGSDLLVDLPPISAQALIRDYVATIIKTYVKDPNRNLDVMQRIHDAVIDRRGAVNLTVLIDVANGTIRQRNETLEPEERFPLLDRQSMYSVGDALLTILSYTRPESATDQWSVQFERDILHAEIVDTLHARLSYARTAAIKEEMLWSSLRLRYPNSTQQELDTIRGELTSGQSAAAVRARFRSRQQGMVAGWKLKKPGGGLIT